MWEENAMQDTLDFIEDNLKAEIAPEELAARAGYSPWHFYRLFAGATGLSVGGYLLKRRLDRALEEISRGSRGVDAALAYGFDTYAGFYKAFTRAYGCSPKKYLALYGPHQSTLLEAMMTTYTKKELRGILAHWDIPQDLPMEDVLIVDGTKTAPDVWTVGDAILRTGPRDQLVNRLRIPKALAKQGIAAAVPVLTKTGAEIFDGEHAFSLTRRIPGEPLPKSERFGEQRGPYGEKYGQSIARLHKALAQIEGDILPDETNLLRQISEWALPDVRRKNVQWKMGLPESFFENWLNEFGALYDYLPRQLIHRDPNPCNILFDGGKVSGFVDFDLSERGVRLWDPCYCATGLLSEWRGLEDIQAKWPAVLEGILRGYDSVSHLTLEEKRAVYHMICAIQMTFVAWCGGQPRPEMQALAKTNRDMLQYIVRQEGFIRNIFA